MTLDRSGEIERGFGMLKKKPFTGKLKPDSERKVHKKFVDYLHAQYRKKCRYVSSATGERFDPLQAKKVADLQWGPGQPDVLMPLIRGRYCGLALELKKEGERPFYVKTGKLKKDEHLQDQAEWLEYLYENGWFCAFSVGFDESVLLADLYIAGKLEGRDPQIRIKQEWQ